MSFKLKKIAKDITSLTINDIKNTFNQTSTNNNDSDNKNNNNIHNMEDNNEKQT